MLLRRKGLLLWFSLCIIHLAVRRESGSCLTYGWWRRSQIQFEVMTMRTFARLELHEYSPTLKPTEATYEDLHRYAAEENWMRTLVDTDGIDRQLPTGFYVSDFYINCQTAEAALDRAASRTHFRYSMITLPSWGTALFRNLPETVKSTSYTAQISGLFPLSTISRRNALAAVLGGIRETSSYDSMWADVLGDNAPPRLFG
jgi:hypothetical protein